MIGSSLVNGVAEEEEANCTVAEHETDVGIDDDEVEDGRNGAKY